MSIGQCIKNTILIIFGMPFYCLPCAVILVEHCTVMLMMLSLRDCQKWREVNDRSSSCWEEPLVDGTTDGQLDSKTREVKRRKWFYFERKAKYLDNLGVNKDQLNSYH